jgi:cobalamin 5'-phosphate synthase/cobalamin synthase
MRRVAAAISFLTRFPLPGAGQFRSVDVGRATLFFPLVGAAIGAAGVAVLKLSSIRVGGDGLHFDTPWLPAPLAALLVVAFSAWITGAIHLDGLADTADGLAGGRTHEDRLRIMRDPAVGTYGVVALILLLAVKVTALSTLIARSVAVPYLILAPALGRWATVALGRFLPYAREQGDGLGNAVTEHVGWAELLGATAIAGGITFLTSGRVGMAGWVAVVALTGTMGRWFQRRIGGVTGDTLGANAEISEAAVLVVAVGMTS